jgi:hypothetical protein
MMKERERERERESFCTSIRLVSHLPPDISMDKYIPYKTKFITLFITLLFSFSFSFLLTLYLLYLAPTSILEVYPCPRGGSLF